MEPCWSTLGPESGPVSSACRRPAPDLRGLGLKRHLGCHPGPTPAQGALRACWRGWMLGGWAWAAAATHAADLLVLLLRVSTR